MKRGKNNSTATIVVAVILVLSACQKDFDWLYQEPLRPMNSTPLARAMADTMTITEFNRTCGVGFSYDGIWGERCSFRDIHSAVLNLEAIRKWEQIDGHSPLFYYTKESENSYKVETAYSHSEYVQKIVAHADVNAKLITFNGNVSGSLTSWEGGQTNDFYCSVSYCSPTLQMTLSGGNIRSLIQGGQTDMLTPNFLDAIEWMDKRKNDAVIDSFLVCYGSHVVTRAKIGGAWDILIKMKQDSLVDIDSREVLGDAVIKGILKTSVDNQDTQKALHMLNSADCNITIRGGDLSTIPNHLLNFRFGDCPNLSKYIDNWTLSLNYYPDDFAYNNLELVDMEVRPIWDFIPNKDVARRVRLRVEGKADELIRYQGYQNFTNTSFPLQQSVTCKMGGRTVTFDNPDIVNVIASGRYVATICREQIDLPGLGETEVQVVYPIYNQQVNLGSGFTTYNGESYRICWLNGICKVQIDTTNIPQNDGMIYMTYGVPGCTKFANVNYQPCHTVIGYEWPMSIVKNGSIDTSKPYYLTYKDGPVFLLRSSDGSEQTGILDGIPNWTYTDGRMVRNREYYYYWNPNEVNYE